MAPVYRPGYVVTTLPPGHRVEVISGTRYYYHNNVYYRPQGRGYVVVDSPRHRGDWDGRRHDGYRDGRDYDRREVRVIRTLPGRHVVVNHRGQRYYRVGNVYYQSREGGYVTVSSPF